jgi:hypothetical protein
MVTCTPPHKVSSATVHQANRRASNTHREFHPLLSVGALPSPLACIKLLQTGLRPPRTCTLPCARPTLPGTRAPCLGSGLLVIWWEASVMAYASSTGTPKAASSLRAAGPGTARQASGWLASKLQGSQPTNNST